MVMANRVPSARGDSGLVSNHAPLPTAGRVPSARGDSGLASQYGTDLPDALDAHLLGEREQRVEHLARLHLVGTVLVVEQMREDAVVVVDKDALELGLRWKVELAQVGHRVTLNCGAETHCLMHGIATTKANRAPVPSSRKAWRTAT
jgi:hypothetical protein